MPWHVAKTSKCGKSKPWGVINSDTGKTDGRCHATKEGAIQQMKAIYANTTEGDREAEPGELAVWDWEGGALDVKYVD